MLQRNYFLLIAIAGYYTIKSIGTWRLVAVILLLLFYCIANPPFFDMIWGHKRLLFYCTHCTLLETSLDPVYLVFMCISICTVAPYAPWPNGDDRDLCACVHDYRSKKFTTTAGGASLTRKPDASVHYLEQRAHIRRYLSKRTGHFGSFLLLPSLPALVSFDLFGVGLDVQ